MSLYAKLILVPKKVFMRNKDLHGLLGVHKRRSGVLLLTLFLFFLQNGFAFCFENPIFQSKLHSVDQQQSAPTGIPGFLERNTNKHSGHTPESPFHFIPRSSGAVSGEESLPSEEVFAHPLTSRLIYTQITSAYL